MMLTKSLRDPFAHIFADFSEIEVKSAPALTRAPLRPRRTLADRVRTALMQLTGGRGTMLAHAEKAWASITFSGTRHEVVLEFCGAEAVAAGEELIERLPDHEFTLPGQLVADATVCAVEHDLLPQPRLTLAGIAIAIVSFGL